MCVAACVCVCVLRVCKGKCKRRSGHLATFCRIQTFVTLVMPVGTTGTTLPSPQPVTCVILSSDLHSQESRVDRVHFGRRNLNSGAVSCVHMPTDGGQQQQLLRVVLFKLPALTSSARLVTIRLSTVHSTKRHASSPPAAQSLRSS